MFEGEPKNKSVHQLRVFRETLPLIESGRKTHEIRVGYPIFRNIKVGDVINFGNGIKKSVTKIDEFRTPEECVAALGVDAFMPNYTPDALLTIWNDRIDRRGNYKKLGILAFKLE